MKNNEWLKVFAPASVANVGPGFDILGFALGGIGDTVSVRKIKDRKIILSEITGDEGKLPKDVKKNVAAFTASLVLKKINPSFGIEMKLHKGMPLGTGLGSSGASVAAGAFAANALCGYPMTNNELLSFCLRGEKMADGGIHIDNAGSSLLGGFILIRSYYPTIDIISLPIPRNLYCVIVHPKFTLLTSVARSVLPKKILLTDHIKQNGNTAALIAAIYSNDHALLKRAIDDCIIEPARSHLIPGFMDVKKAALKNGALGCSISGGGPSVFAFAPSKNTANQIAKSMCAAFAKHKLPCSIYISKIEKKGARVMHE